MIFAAGFGEQDLRDVIDVAVRVVEAAGAIVIFVGAAIAFGRFLLVSFRQEGMAPFAPVRLDLGRFLALGLEFQLAADILRTAVAPSFTALATILSTPSVIKYKVTGEAPTVLALRAPRSAFSGPSINVVPRSVSSACMGLPSGPFMTARFVKPKAF